MIASNPHCRRRLACSAVLLLLSGLLPSCAEGGDEDRPMSEIQLAAAHHVVGIIGSVVFPQFPVRAIDASPIAGTFDLDADSAYSLQSAGQTVFADRYALEETGAFTVFQARPNASTLLYAGGYGLEGDTGHYFFSDRVTGNVGLFFGVPRIDGMADLPAFAGDWHLFSMHVLFADNAALEAPDSIGRSFAGEVTVAADGTFTGAGSESVSPAAQLPVTGSLGAFMDGRVSFDVDYGGDVRSFDGGSVVNLVVGAGVEEAAESAAGLAAMVRARSTAPQLADLAGIFDLGGWVLGVTPANSGFDSVFGSLELTDAGQFQLEVSNNFGISRQQDGDFSVATDGGLTFTVTSPTEVWLGAVDESGNTIILIDNVRSTSPTISSALRFLVATRRKTV